MGCITCQGIELTNLVWGRNDRRNGKLGALQRSLLWWFTKDCPRKKKMSYFSIAIEPQWHPGSSYARGGGLGANHITWPMCETWAFPSDVVGSKNRGEPVSFTNAVALQTINKGLVLIFIKSLKVWLKKKSPEPRTGKLNAMWNHSYGVFSLYFFFLLYL